MSFKEILNLKKIEGQLNSVSKVLDRLAAVALVCMMLLTCLDVVLRFFRHPIPGTYEMVGFSGALLVSFSLAHTSVNRGHIAVDFLVSKFPRRLQGFIDRINSLICAFLFGLISWQSAIYALDTKNAGEVSMTLQAPVFPFIFGVSAGCGVLCLVLVLRFLLSFTTDKNIVR